MTLKQFSESALTRSANRRRQLLVNSADSAGFCSEENVVLPSGRSIYSILFSLLTYVLLESYGELNCDGLHILITLIYISTPLLTSTHKIVLARDPSS